MKPEEVIMARIWSRIIEEVRILRAQKYTLERIGSILGVSKPTVQRWLENDAGGEKTAFIDILRYLNALEIDPQGLLFGDGKTAGEQVDPGVLEEKDKEIEELKIKNAALTQSHLLRQQELLVSQKNVIELQDRIIQLEQRIADLRDKARKIAAAAAVRTSNAEQQREAPQAVKQRPARPSPANLYPDIPPIHIGYDDD